MALGEVVEAERPGGAAAVTLPRVLMFGLFRIHLVTTMTSDLSIGQGRPRPALLRRVVLKEHPDALFGQSQQRRQFAHVDCFWV